MKRTVLRLRCGGGDDALADAVARVASAWTIEALVAAFRSGARAMLGADGVAFVRRDGDSVVYHAEDAVGTLWAGLSFPIRTCISGHAMIDRATIVVPDITVDPRIPQIAYRPTFVRSLVVTPVGRGEPCAAMGVYWAHTGCPAPAVVEAIEALAAAAGAALDRIEGPAGRRA